MPSVDSHPSLLSSRSFSKFNSSNSTQQRTRQSMKIRTTNFPNFGQAQVSVTRYKTELCRPFTETGKCKYGDKCQFSHGIKELRILLRHPKYKTEYCRTFHSTGYCPYGPRCHFIHETHEARSTTVSNSNESSRQTNSIFNKIYSKNCSTLENSTQFPFTLEELNRALLSFNLNEHLPMELSPLIDTSLTNDRTISSSSSSTNSSSR